MNNEIDDILRRIESSHKSVMGAIVATSDGAVLKSTFKDSLDTSTNYAAIITDIVDKARQALKEKDHLNDELTFLKIRTKKTEFIVVPAPQCIEALLTHNAWLAHLRMNPIFLRIEEILIVKILLAQLDFLV